MPTPKRNVHLHLVDISAGWHLCRSFTVDEFRENRQTRIYDVDDTPLEDLVDLEIGAENFLHNASDIEMGNDHESATAGFMLFASLLKTRLAEEVEPHDYVGAAGDWLLAVVDPREEYSGPVILMTDCIVRDDFVPLSGDSLGHAVQSMLSRALPRDGFTVDMMQVHSRWTAADPKKLL